jgi:NADH:ubiquinone reductase (H+-translocating)
MERIVVLGGGFAGLWSAVGAARALDEFQIRRDDVIVMLVNRDGWHAIRVRNYEPDLPGIKVALDGRCGSAAWWRWLMCGWYERI